MTRIITLDDLQEFKKELRDYCNQLIALQSAGITRRYLKSDEVMDLLRVSPGTLQNLRINGTLPYMKLGGMIYYDFNEIQNVMEKNRVQHRRKPKP